jgi:hypothetical protein
MRPLSFLGGLGSSELEVLLGVPLLYALPIWLSFRKYGEGRAHWRIVSIVATLFLSWIGYILVSAIESGAKGYAEGRIGKSRE